MLIINGEFGDGDSDSENSDGVNDSIGSVKNAGGKKAPEGDSIKDIFVKNEEIAKDVKHGDKDRMESVMEVVGMEKDIKDGITVNNNVAGDYRTLFLAKKVV